MKCTFSTPFDSLPPISYTSVGRVSLKSLLNDGYRPYETIYEPFSIPVEIYKEDLAKDVYILLLKGGGKSIYVPEYKIENMNDDAITFTNKTISLKLGVLPDNLSLDTLLEDINTMIASRIGVKPKADIINVSASNYLPKATEVALITEREALIGDKTNLYYKHESVKRLFEKEVVKNEQLKECIIKMK